MARDLMSVVGSDYRDYAPEVPFFAVSERKFRHDQGREQFYIYSF
jgi:hypothetical protein